MRRRLQQLPPEVIRDRALLAAGILVVWAFIKLLEWMTPSNTEEMLPGPIGSVLIFSAVFILSVYSLITYLVQHRSFLSLEGQAQGQDLPTFDVLIPAHDEKRVIRDTLDKLLAIDYPSLHILVIDDHSTDGTEEVVREYLLENNLSESRVRLLVRRSRARRGKAAALNEALAMTSGEYVLVIDADGLVEPHSLRLALSYFQSNSKLGALQFQRQLYNAERNLLTRCQDFEFAVDTYLQNGRQLLGGFVELRGSGQIFRRRCLEEVGGWDEAALTEDLEISTRIHISDWEVVFAPDLVLREEGVVSPRAFLRQRRRWAEGSLRRYLKHFGAFFGIRSPLSLSARLDILPFLTQFAIPIWLFLDLAWQPVRYFWLGKPTHLTILMLATLVVSAVMWFNIFVAVKRWRSLPMLEALGWSLATFLYGAVHWPAIVLWTARKVLFGRRPTAWHKTPRVGQAVAPQ